MHAPTINCESPPRLPLPLVARDSARVLARDLQARGDESQRAVAPRSLLLRVRHVQPTNQEAHGLQAIARC